MTMEEAIQQLDGAEMMVLNREITQFNQAIIMAISALHTQQKQANECTKCQSDKIRHKQESVHNDPLVLDELRQMRGEPVWCKELECYGIVKMEKVGRWANELFLVGTWHNGDVAVNFEYDIKSRPVLRFTGISRRRCKMNFKQFVGGGWFALFKLISDIARNALVVMGTAKSVTTGTTYSAETGNGRIGEGSSDHG